MKTERISILKDFRGMVSVIFCTLLCVGIAPLSALSGETEQQRLEELLEESNQYRVAGNYDQSLGVLEKAKALAEREGSSFMMAEVLNRMGNIYIYKSQYSVALTYLQRALTIYNQIGNEEGIAECLNNIASIHFSLQNYYIAKENWQKSLAIRKRSGSQRQIAISKTNLGLILTSLNKLDSALMFHQKSLEIWEKLDEPAGVGISLLNLSKISKAKGNNIEALDLLEKSYNTLNNLGSAHENTKLNVRSEIGLLLTEMEQYEEAIQWCKDLCGEDLNRQYTRYSKNCCYSLYKSYQAMAMDNEALKYYQNYIEIRDSTIGRQTVQEITSLELKYAFDQIQKADSLRFESESQLQQERIDKHRIGLYASGGILIMVGLLIIVIYRGKRRSEKLLLNILPAEVAKELKTTGKATAREYSSVTVMFADVIKFTEISERLSPEELVHVINSYFTVFDEIMAQYGIEKIKTIGDCYMAAGGLPVENESHPIDVVEASIAIQKAVETINEKFENIQKDFFKFRIGIHSGPVVAGIVGTKKFQYDIWGDTVNTASRLENTSEGGKINISSTTYELIKDHFTCTHRGQVEVKGKGVVNMYFVESKK